MQAFQFDTIDSTNEAAKRMIRSGKIQGNAYLLARTQTAGKGTRGRSWASPKDAGIYLSVVGLPNRAVPASVTTYTLAAGVACVEALRESVGIATQLKPVNDIHVDGRKLGGVLVETIMSGSVVEAVITGVGINMGIADRPVRSDAASPVCLEELVTPEQFAKIDVNALAANLVARLTKWNTLVESGREAEVRAAWEQHCI